MSPEDIEEVLRRMGAPAGVHEEGSIDGNLVFNNAEEATPFENELCSGAFLALHRATHDKALDKSGAYSYGEYFMKKSRVWEARLQMRFKVPPKVEDLYFGVEIDSYVPMAGAAKQTLELVVRLLKGAVGQQVYHSVGDDPRSHEGPIERPCFVMPLWAFDQFIVTPSGETAPELTDPVLPDMGSKRYRRISEYRSEVSELDFQVGPTYTFCFWGISKWLDKLNWQIKLPLSPLPVNFNTFCGSPPVHVVMYTLKPAEEGETRHLEHRKNMYFRLAFWSSKCRPSFEKMDHYLRLSDRIVGDPDAAAAPLRRRSSPARSKASAIHGRQMVQPMRSFVSCCAPFIYNRSRLLRAPQQIK
jgi:hypothetical protein